MTNKQRVHAVLEGTPVDRCPVTSLYSQLYWRDHFRQVTGRPRWQLHQWKASSPQEYVELLAKMHAKAQFELIEPESNAPSRLWREHQEFILKDGQAFRHDLQTDEWEQLDTANDDGHADHTVANETQYVFTKADVDERLEALNVEKMIADGANDYIDAVVERFGKDEFILSGGVIGTLYRCHSQVGLTNLFRLLIEEPELIDYLSEKLLQQNLLSIRRLAAAGGDAIYIDDATATSDMISPAMYERFSLPYMKAMVSEIHRLGHKAILIYFGGISDRLNQIAATGADGLSYEASMKGFVNDTAEIADAIGDHMTLFSNIDPLGILQDGTDTELEEEIKRQVEAGRRARGFVIAPASPITPNTSLPRVQKFLELARRIGRTDNT